MIYDKQRPLHILLGGGTGNYREYTLILQNCASLAWYTSDVHQPILINFGRLVCLDP